MEEFELSNYSFWCYLLIRLFFLYSWIGTCEEMCDGDGDLPSPST